MSNTSNALYHATFRTRLPSIKKLGLGAKQIKNWDFSEDKVVCLTTDPNVAFSFCETADDVSDSVYESGIIVLAINSRVLDRRLVAVDHNINTDDSTTGASYYTYKGIILPQHLYVATSSKGIVGQLLKLSRVPAYE